MQGKPLPYGCSEAKNGVNFSIIAPDSTVSLACPVIVSLLLQFTHGLDWDCLKPQSAQLALHLKCSRACSQSHFQFPPLGTYMALAPRGRNRNPKA